jgi:hypothetical protein
LNPTGNNIHIRLNPWLVPLYPWLVPLNLGLISYKPDVNKPNWNLNKLEFKIIMLKHLIAYQRMNNHINNCKNVSTFLKGN